MTIRKKKHAIVHHVFASLRRKSSCATHRCKHNITCRPEFISGANQFVVGLETDKMLKQVQNDDIFVVGILRFSSPTSFK